MNKMITPSKYKSYNGTLYEVLYEASHPMTKDRFIVFYKTSERDSILVLPKEQFLKYIYEENHFRPTQPTTICKTPASISFPEINYTKEFLPLVDGNEFTKSVKSMISLLSNKGLISNVIFSRLKTDDDIEAIILKKIKAYSCNETMEEIFHLIQIWGGITGRGVYILEKPFDWNKIAPHYQKLAEECMSISDINDKSIEMLISCINEFNTSVKHMGVSFITKHTRYWLYRNINENALPIYDRIMANCIMRKNSAQLIHLPEYWKAMIKKSRQLNISLMALERQIFKYAYTQL